MRYSKLQELSPADQGELALRLCQFFGPTSGNEWRKQMGMPLVSNSIRPLSIADFFKWTPVALEVDYHPRMHKVRETVRKLVNAGMLVEAGKSGGSPFFSDCFYTTVELSTLASKGTLWLGRALGARYIGSRLEKALVQVLGTTKEGDEGVGSALHILPDVLLTCAHVVDDMKLNDKLLVNGQQTSVVAWKSAKDADVGIIRIEPIPLPLPDIALRSANVLEEVVIAGYPSVPTVVSSLVTYQRGEISAVEAKTYQHTTVDLFTAIARPGNSGGPVVGLDGRVVGIVTRSLERNREEADAMPPIPFFASVPADVIQSSVREIADGLELPWEDHN